MQHLSDIIPEPTTLAEARAIINQMETDTRWNVYTRPAMERRIDQLGRGYGIVVGDIDQMKQANTRWGWSSTDERIRRALNIRRSDVWRGRLLWGDEIIIIAPAADVQALTVRLLADFVAEDMSATFVVVANVGTNYNAAIEAAQAQLMALKNSGQRGQIAHLETIAIAQLVEVAR